MTLALAHRTAALGRHAGVLGLTLLLALPATACDGLFEDDPLAGDRSSSQPVLVTSLTSAAQVRDLYAAEAVTPEGALKVWLTCAIMMTSRNLNEYRLGRGLIGELTLPHQGNPEWYTLYSQRTFLGRLDSHPHTFRSYAVGATPTNGYAMDPNAWQLNVASSAADASRGWRVSITSGGADSPRPVYLRQGDDGLWYVNEYANVYVDVRPPL